MDIADIARIGRGVGMLVPLDENGKSGEIDAHLMDGGNSVYLVIPWEWIDKMAGSANPLQS